MTPDERRALEALRFNWAWKPDDVWGDSRFHVEGMHAEVDREVLAGLRDAKEEAPRSPIGLVVRGQRGAGKTHLLGWVRLQAQREGGYFFLVDLDQVKDFWAGVSLAVRRDLLRVNGSGESQLTVLLRRLAAKAGLAQERTPAITGETRPSKKDIDDFLNALRIVDLQVAAECRLTLRALVLYGSPDDELSTIGGDYLGSFDESRPGERAEWGIRPSPRAARLVVRDVSWLLAMTGPTVIAVDQLDPIAAQSGPDITGTLSLERVALGLMALHDNTRRALSLVACITPTWKKIKEAEFATAADRFREVGTLGQIADAAIAREMVVQRLAVPYAEVGFVPPYPTWPIAEHAFDGIEKRFTPRALLQRVDTHVRYCLRVGKVSELDGLDTQSEKLEDVVPAQRDLSSMDHKFAELKQNSDVRSALDSAHEDRIMRELMMAALTAWMVEQDGSGVEWKVDPPFGTRSPLLHARLRRTLDEETEAEAHWSFRAIAHPNPRAAQTRLRNARLESGLRTDGTRNLVILRNSKWPGGPVTAREVSLFKEGGGLDLPVTDDDLRTFRALETLLREKPPGLEAWLIARKPATGTEVLGTVLGTQVEARSAPAPGGQAKEEPELADSRWITVGETMADESPVRIALEAFRRHTAIFAGPGSGKTVLIRRIVEECASRGVSSIVLDPNNDLARLGDPWPEPPPGWQPGDARLADEYFAGTEIVVWTPGLQAGRPLGFQPLPDFAGVGKDPDDFNRAVEVAAATLAPRANITGRGNKAEWSKAILREALDYYARRGKRSLEGFIRLLADLPEGASTLDGAPKLAAELAKSLHAARVNDPLFGGSGEPVEPGVLLSPSPGKKSRVSVISFVGLQTEEQRQGFVNQLQLELFAWIKNNPAGDRPLGGLFVMDEAQTFAPAGASTPSTQSTLMLVAQARKFGLGMVFATQAPKAINNRIAGNSATQFFGQLNAPTQVAAARGIAQSKGGTLDHIGALKVGQFYATTEGTRPQRVRTPNCLSHHPKSALTPEEVIKRATT
ncbi:helicase HerA domain-containing protein [Amycolatopsis speibonae]|uniref:Helicase HerA domain-containing protein n=1 Tax=Amycolatopsis speibonae TaxID=1450224 RepID=A0ABV7P048_9PSEU